MNVIEVQKLRKTYGRTTAVNNISFNVQQGEIFCIVGPNGAGKSTTVESVMGLRQPDSGSIRVLGLNPQKEEQALRQRIGIQLQQAALPERIKVWEVLDLYSAFYEKTVSWEKAARGLGLN